MHADRTNRVALIVFGLLVLAPGAASMAASTGVFGTAFSRRILFANRVSSTSATTAGCGTPPPGSAW
jgi:hypothetical protein